MSIGFDCRGRSRNPAHAKRTKGIFTNGEAKYKKGGDLDDFCDQLYRHFKNHGINTVAYRRQPNTAVETMVSVFTHYPHFTTANIRAQNLRIEAEYNTYNCQNDNDALACFMNSLGDDYRRSLRVKNNPAKELKFTDIFMLFIEIERPQNAELYDSYEQKVLTMKPENYPGRDIVKMAEFA